MNDFFNSPSFLQAFQKVIQIQISNETEPQLPKEHQEKPKENKLTNQIFSFSINNLIEDTRTSKQNVLLPPSNLMTHSSGVNTDYQLNNPNQPLIISIKKNMWSDDRLILAIKLKNYTEVVWENGWLITAAQESEVFPCDIGIKKEVPIGSVIQVQFSFISDINQNLMQKGQHKLIFQLEKNSVHKLQQPLTIILDTIE